MGTCEDLNGMSKNCFVVKLFDCSVFEKNGGILFSSHVLRFTVRLQCVNASLFSIFWQLAHCFVIKCFAWQFCLLSFVLL